MSNTTIDSAHENAQSPEAASAAPLLGPDYRAMLVAYRDSHLGRSVWQLLTSIVPFLALWILMWWTLQFSWLPVLLLAFPAAGFLVRLFILQHDCGHGSFFRSTRANNLVGCGLSIFTLMPYYRWRKTHAVHHATSGDLDRRGSGDVHMLTVAEYRASSALQRLSYRVHRHPLVLFGIGPFLYFVVFQRFAHFLPREWKRERANVYWTNLVLLAAGSLICWLVGLPQFLLIHLPIVIIAGSVGVWLFYVQHHFEPTYWKRRAEWDYHAAGMYGSSYYKLPVWLQWITANIGLHHIHHLDSQIPNYRLQQCFDENLALQQVHELTFWESLSCASLRLWDEEQGVMVCLPPAEP